MDNQPQQPTTPQPAQPQPVQPIQPVSPPSSKKKPVMLGVLGIVLLLVLGVGVWWYLTSGKQSANSNQQAVAVSPSPEPTIDPTADWETYSSPTLGFVFKYSPDYVFQKTTTTNGKQTVHFQHKDYDYEETKDVTKPGSAKGVWSNFDITSQKINGKLEEYIVQTFKLKAFKLGKFDGYELSKDPKELTVFQITQEKYGENTWLHVSVPGIDDNFYYLRSPDGVLASTYNGYGAFIEEDV